MLLNRLSKNSGLALSIGISSLLTFAALGISHDAVVHAAITAMISGTALSFYASKSRFALLVLHRGSARIPLVGGLILLGTSGAILLQTLLVFALLGWFPGRLVEADLLFRVVAVGAAVYLGHLSFYLGESSRKLLLEAEQSMHQSELRERDLKRALLEARYKPHFLFNALNSLSALTSKDPRLAREMCSSLGEYLRESLSSGAELWSTLETELESVERYINIEKLRFGERLQFEVNIDSSLRSLRLPKWVVQPLVENAVQHGVGSMLDTCKILLRSAKQAGFIEVMVDNPCGNESVRRSTQLGIVNLRKRLSDLSDGRASLSLRPREGGFQVVLRWPLELSEGA